MPKKIVSSLLLLGFVFLLLSPAAKAADSLLLEPSREGQTYRIQLASPDPLSDLLSATLGTLANTVFNQTGENLMKWLGDVMHFGLLNSYLLLAGPAGLEGPGYCTPTENHCSSGYSPNVVGALCECVQQSAFARPPSDYGAVGILGGMTTGLLEQSPPDLQTAYYFKQELADNLLAQPAFAQTGKTYFDPIIGIATLFRNVAYLFMLIILIWMGLMVMLRSQIDPRTVMSVTAALPRIATSLILIAFSYPLAGMLVDVGRLLKAMLDALLGGIMPLHGIEPFQLIVDFIMSFLFSIYLGGTGIFSVLIGLGLMIVAMVVAFMLFFTLVFRFAALYAQVIFAPLAFAWGALPGQEDTITKWFKSFAVNVLTFPAIYFLVNLARFIALITGSVGIGVPLSMPLDLGWGTWGPPRLWPGAVTNVGGLVAFGLLMAATKVPAMLEDAFEVTAPAAVAKAGVEPMGILKRVPVVGGIFK